MECLYWKEMSPGTKQQILYSNGNHQNDLFFLCIGEHFLRSRTQYSTRVALEGILNTTLYKRYWGNGGLARRKI